MTPLTEVELLWQEGVVERWLRFGKPIEETIIDRRRRLVAFAPGAVFAYVRWAANAHGTIVSRLDILRAAGPGEALQTIPYIRPGGESLLRLFGWPVVQRALQHINAIEAAGVDPVDVDPDHWRHVHNRLVARETPRAYDRARHRAWLRRQRFCP
ncbi:MAG: DUF2840 domain-containing protein [Caulobacter sp.]|nr:DUF2840 domain-containing protein [Caulobacter sp.]